MISDLEYELLRTLVSQYHEVSEAAFKSIVDLGEVQHVEKNDVFITRGNRNEREYFLLEGICKSHLLDYDGNDVTLGFFEGLAVLSPFTTRTQEDRSILNFTALTDLKVVHVNAGTFEELMIDNEEIRLFGNTVLRHELMQKVQKEMLLATASGKEKLISFREWFPTLENHVSHVDIASYLGMTTVSLSRLRKELM
jgi:CRP-like cAMP-binding protein